MDCFFLLRLQELMEQRLLLVSVDESDLNCLGRWPLADAILARYISRLGLPVILPLLALEGTTIIFQGYSIYERTGLGLAIAPQLYHDDAIGHDITN